jgi:hypothetical protein
MPRGSQLSEQEWKQRWIELDRAELPSKIADGSRVHLTVHRHMAGVIGHTYSET